MIAIDTSANRSTIPRRVLVRLTRRSDAAGALQLIGHTLLLSLTGALVLEASGALASFAAMFAHGVALIFLFAALHECIHRTAFRSRWLNDAVSALAGLVLLLPPRYFRAYHLRHHRHTQDPQRDPELTGAMEFGLRGYLWRMSGFPVWGHNIRTLWLCARGDVPLEQLDSREQRAIVVEARVYLAIYAALVAASLLAKSPLIVSLWLAPALLGQPLLRAYLFAEHTGCELSDDMLRNSRTVHTNALLRWLSWNMCYHAEHHLAASIPFHALPRAHEWVAPSLARTASGYWRVHREGLQSMRARHARGRGGAHAAWEVVS